MKSKRKKNKICISGIAIIIEKEDPSPRLVPGTKYSNHGCLETPFKVIDQIGPPNTDSDQILKTVENRNIKD